MWVFIINMIFFFGSVWVEYAVYKKIPLRGDLLCLFLMSMPLGLFIFVTIFSIYFPYLFNKSQKNNLKNRLTKRHLFGQLISK